MNRNFSIYLDIVRFGAAFLVFFYHLSFPNFFYLLPWVDVGHQAVIVFFVLSGYVIAYVSDTKNRDFGSYFISRLSRLYSVVIPALLFSVAAYYVGREANPAVYGYDGVANSALQDAFYLLVNAFFLNQIWFFETPSFANTPYWSLGYEFWYYVLFGVAFYLRKWRRTVFLLTLVLFVGPKILLLLPAWLLGVWAYHHNKTVTRSGNAGWILFLAPIGLFFVYYFTELRSLSKLLASDNLGFPFAAGWSKYFLVDYVVAVLVTCNIIGFYKIADRFSDFLAKYERPIRWLASYTFSLYLFHYPLLHFFAAVLDHEDRKSVV